MVSRDLTSSGPKRERDAPGVEEGVRQPSDAETGAGEQLQADQHRTKVDEHLPQAAQPARE